MIERRPVVLPDGSWVNAVVGYRLWFNQHKSLNPSALGSISHDYEWPVHEVVEARCLPFAFTDPKTHVCRCKGVRANGHGIYAYNSVRRLEAELHENGFTIFKAGEVALFGEVVVCETGYVATHALPLCLYEVGRRVLPNFDAQAAWDRFESLRVRSVYEAAARHGIPVVRDVLFAR